jgi:hypothetical protein
VHKRKEEATIVVAKVYAQASKPLRPLNYPYHICGIVGHKLTNCSKFSEMKNIFKDKGAKAIKS